MRITNLPKRLQKVYNTLVDNNIVVSDVYLENSEGNGELSWWFELGNDFYLDDMTGTIHEDTATQVIGRIKTESIYKVNDETKDEYDSSKIVFINDKNGDEKDYNPYTNKNIK